MRLIKKIIHKDVEKLDGKIFKRRASRGIILKGSKILLLYTKRYNDYSFPGGGVDKETKSKLYSKFNKVLIPNLMNLRIRNEKRGEIGKTSLQEDNVGDSFAVPINSLIVI